jgi:glycosyltransferase involved in cell wall biosynthesis
MSGKVVPVSKLISIGIPVKNEFANIPTLRKEITTLISSKKYEGLSFEILINQNLSNDGSKDLLEEWEISDNRVSVYNLLQPLEFQETIKDLMGKASGHCFALIQSDLQDPVRVLEKLIDTWLLNQDQIVAGRVAAKDEFFPVLLTRKLFYFLLDISSDKPYASGFQDFYVLPKYVYQEIAKLPSHNMFIRGYLNYFFTNIHFVDYKRLERLHGKSNFNFTRMYDLALDGLLLYGRRFIRCLSLMSFSIFILSTCTLISILCLASFGFDPGIKGWMSIASGISLILSIFGLVSGVILEYLIRIHRALQFRQE